MSTESRPYIGGQAVIEGVMMRSPGSMSIVCRRRTGELVVREQPMTAVAEGWRKLPFLRGIATVVESLKLGSGALRWSADLFEQDLIEEEEAAKRDAARGSTRASGTPSVMSTMSMLALSVVALATQQDGEPAPGAPRGEKAEKKGAGILAILPTLFAITLFVAAPQGAAEGINKLFGLGLEVTAPGYQAITGAAKLLIIVTYLLLIRQMGEVRRVFQYHGAEHKTITTYEAGEDLVVANARPKTTAHPRCGTTFLVMVAMVSVLVFSIAGAFLPKLPGGRLAQFVGFFLLKLPFLPIVAAVTYEIQRIFARYCTTGPLRALLWPGFLVQKITTAEPDDDQLEVALASLRATLWREAAREAPIRADRTFPTYDDLIADPGYAASTGALNLG
jgi:uncharacterized protein YqhQ